MELVRWVVDHWFEVSTVVLLVLILFTVSWDEGLSQMLVMLRQQVDDLSDQLDSMERRFDETSFALREINEHVRDIESNLSDLSGSLDNDRIKGS